MKNKNNVLRGLGYMLCCVVVYIIVTYLMDLLFGDTTENYDWLGVAVSGVVFAVILFLLRLYEEKKINK